MNHIQLHSDMQSFIDTQFDSHAGLNLLDFTNWPCLFHNLSGEMLTFTMKNRRFVIAHLAIKKHRDSLVNHFLNGITQYTYRYNQFIRIHRPYINLLTAEYYDFIDRFDNAVNRSMSQAEFSEKLKGVFIDHLARLRAILLSQTEYLTGNTTDHSLLQTVTCSEYSVDLQRRILAVDNVLTEPVLDIGCGSGSFVKELVAHSVDAYGIDRSAPTSKHLTTIDWFDFEFEPNRWGSILAHQSLSTHFLFHHRHRTTETARYAALFMRVLKSLRIGGTLHYSPGLPFFEPEIESLDTYKVSKTQLSSGSGDITDIAYATAITRTG